MSLDTAINPWNRMHKVNVQFILEGPVDTFDTVDETADHLGELLIEFGFGDVSILWKEDVSG